MIWYQGKSVSWILQNLKLKNRCLFWTHNPGSLIVYISLSNIDQSTKRHMWMFTVALVIILKKKTGTRPNIYQHEWVSLVYYIHIMECCSVHRLQQARLSCPSLSLGVCSNSCPLSQWCYRTILSSAPPSPLSSVFPSIRVFSNELALCIKWPTYWSFSFSISSSNEYSELIFFRIDWESKGLSRVFSSTTIR